MIISNNTSLISFMILQTKSFEHNVKMEGVGGRDRTGKGEKVRDRHRQTNRR